MTGVQTCALPDRKSTRLNSSHTIISYAVFCLKKKPAAAAVAAPGRGPPQLRAGALTPSGPCDAPLPRLKLRAAQLPTAAAPILLFFFLMIGGPPKFPLFPYPTPFR